MSWTRYFSQRVFRRYRGYMEPETASRYMNITRMVYFFSASSLAIMVWKMGGEDKQSKTKRILEAGRPVIEDLSEGHRVLRTSGADVGIIYSYDPQSGLKKMEFNKDEYYQLLEKQALEKAKKAQEEAIVEGRELPPDAIKLV